MADTIRCDLALEARELLIQKNGEDTQTDGVFVETENNSEYINITRVRVTNEEGEKSLGKKQGNYITVEMPARFYGEQKIYEEMCKACAKELKALTDKFLKTPDDIVLVVGLGNWNITADALGPKVVSALMITRHLKKYIPHEIDEGIRPVCGISPGVLGITGIETGEIVMGLTGQVKPNLIIAVDALCSRKVERINTTIQFSDTGITPGAGVGNKRMAIDKDTLGVPVIAIGVPTVVDAATIAGDAMAQVFQKTDEKNALTQMDEHERYSFIKETITPTFGNFIVAPKEVDTIINDISRVIANSINISLHEGITLNDIDRYV